MTILFVTTNSYKLHTMQKHVAHLGITVESMQLPIVEVQADTPEEVAISKAKQAYALVKAPLVVEDSAFFIDELGGFPGPYVKYVMETLGVNRLLKLTEHLQSRRCRFVSVLAYADADGKIRTFTDKRGEGSLAKSSAPLDVDEAWSEVWRIFIPTGFSRPMSVLSDDERSATQKLWQENSSFHQFAEWLRATEPKSPS